jgi:hypothetical protein
MKMELGEPDASGRKRPIPIPGSEFVIPADTVIAAVAQAPEISFLEETKGLEITPEMIELAEKNRTVENVEFMVYDGVHFPVVPYFFDLVLSVGVLQTMKGGLLKNTLPSWLNI